MPDVHDQPVDEIVRVQLETAEDPVLVIQPSAAVFEQVVEVVGDVAGSPVVRVLGGEALFKDAFEDFLVACRTADGIEDGTLDIRVAEITPGNQVLVTQGELTALVEAGETVVGVSTGDSGAVEPVNTHYTGIWNDAETYSLRTPALSRIQETLREKLGDEVADDFNTVIESADSIPGSSDLLDEVGVSLLVAAKNSEMLYDISKWGEDTGLASKATFSRAKTGLEDHGLIDTEKVPIDVGRPRLRLLLGDDELADASAEDLIQVARTRLEQTATA